MQASLARLAASYSMPEDVSHSCDCLPFLFRPLHTIPLLLGKFLLF